MELRSQTAVNVFKSRLKRHFYEIAFEAPGDLTKYFSETNQ